MALPNSGPLSLSDIQTEFGGSNPISLSEYYKGGAFVLNTDFAPNVPSSGTISISDFYGARKTTLTTLTFNTPGDNLFVIPATVVGNLQIVTMTGAGGGGGGPDTQPGASGYGGVTVTGGSMSVAPGDIVNAYVGAGGGAGGSGGGGGGGGGKIICTKLYELGLLSKDIYLADQAFGAELIKTSPDVYNGYRAWAEIVVDWMSGQGPMMMPWMSKEKFASAAKTWSVTWAQEIATPWANEMAYKMGKKESGSTTGKLITAVGVPICKVVGVWQRVVGPSKKPAGFVKGAMLIPVFVLFKLIVKLGKLIESKNHDR
jgi:hypothetical protein